MKKLLLIIFLFLLNFMPAFAKASTEEEMQTFYQHKSQELAKNIIQDISDKKILEEGKPRMAIRGFIFGVFLENPAWQEQFKTTNLSLEVAVVIQDAKRLLNKDTTGYSNPDAIATWIVETKDLDWLWGIFFATGNPKIPEGIRLFIEKEDIKAQEVHQGESKKVHVINVTAMSAEWSMAALAKKHPIVKASVDKLRAKKLKIYKNYIN